MNKWIWITPLIIFGILIISTMIFDSNLIPDIINNILPQNIDASCKVDSDCRLYIGEGYYCGGCSNCKFYDISDEEVIAVNKNWKPYCPLKTKSRLCPTCVGGISGMTKETFSGVKCVNEKCQKLS